VPFAALYHVFLLSANTLVPQEASSSQGGTANGCVPVSDYSRTSKERKGGAPEIPNMA